MKKPLASLVLLALAISTSPAGPTAAQVYQQGRAAFYSGDYETAKAKLMQVLAASPNHTQTRALLAQIAAKEEARGGNPVMERKMQSIVLDSFDVEEATIQEAVEFLMLKTKSSSPEEYRPNIILKGVPASGRKISLKLANVPASYALSSVGNLAGVKFSYDKYAIIGTPVSGGPAPANSQQ